MVLLDEEKVTLTSLDAGEVFVAGRFHSLIPIAQEVSQAGLTSHYAVAVVKKNTLADVNSLRDLKGKKACFANVGTMAGWIIPVHTVRNLLLVMNLYCCLHSIAFLAHDRRQYGDN